MSLDSTSSEVTYTPISSDGDPLACAVDLFGLYDPDSPEAAPASTDYVPDPEEPEQAPPSQDYVPGPEYPKGTLARCLATLALPSSPHPIVPYPYGSPNHVRAP
nr:hypothetical protein [Tanacetum cinerariifolium]